MNRQCWYSDNKPHYTGCCNRYCCNAELCRLLNINKTGGNYIMKTNKMLTFHFNVLTQLYCLRHVSNIQMFILRMSCKCSFMVCIAYSPVVGRMCFVLSSGCLYGCMKDTFYRTACTSLSEDEHLDVRNMSQTL